MLSALLHKASSLLYYSYEIKTKTLNERKEISLSKTKGDFRAFKFSSFCCLSLGTSEADTEIRICVHVIY